MSKHWTTPESDRQRSASPRASPAERFRPCAAPGVKTESHTQSSSPASVSGGVPLPRSLTKTFNNCLDGAFDMVASSPGTDQDSSPGGAPLKPEDFAPIHDVEAAVAACFDSPSPTREERRKTLHIHSPVDLSRLRSATPTGSPSSSEAWTGDDIFVPKSPYRSEFGVDQMRTVPTRHHVVSCIAGATCSRSPLRQRHDSGVRVTPKTSRFRVMEAEAPPGEAFVTALCLNVREI